MKLIPALLAMVSLGALGPRLDAATAARPNIIVIMADDMGAGELGAYGHPTHRTPNLDQLARTGVKFETAYTSPVCHPTRFTLMTGQYGFRTGVLNFSGKRGGPPVKHEGADDISNHVTFGQVLKNAGYATALAGKWQLSGSYPTVVREAGFDEFCIWGYREHYSADDRAKAEAAGISFRSRYWHPSVCRNGRWVPTGANDYGPDIFSDFLLEFVRRKRDQPFFIYYPMPLTHGPWLPTPDSYQPGMNRERSNAANFQANVEYTDKLIGRLLHALEQAGVRENTLIIFTGDNGTGGDGKSTATEKGARVPLIVNAPGLIKTRGTTLALADTSDVFPTVVEFAAANVPAKHVVDGRSLAPFLRGERDTTREWIFAYQADRRILRTERWLLEDNSPRHYGKLIDCGASRDGTGYRDVTNSKDTEVIAARAYFDRLLENLPAPLLDHDGAPNEKNDPEAKRAKRQKKKQG
ncbi:MAG: sulfatase-like hydrolase/transferase [Opitutaceae bacterium]|nr:sulfatase-like hydrolase/transferase [Opitutaceae bacterium]